jgi:hypothetical protein
MGILTIMVCGILGLAIMGAIILLPLRLRFARALRKKTDQELAQSVFRYEDLYFATIGEGHPDVVAFRDFVQQKNLSGIRKHWSKFRRTFMRLEREAGHRGRPLIMEYYNWYEMSLRELSRRRTVQGLV